MGKQAKQSSKATQISILDCPKDSWGTKSGKVSTFPRMGGNPAVKQYENAILPPQSLIVDILARVTNKTKGFVKQNSEGKWEIDVQGLDFISDEFQAGTDVPFDTNTIKPSLDRFVNKQIGRFSSRHGNSPANVLDFSNTIIKMINNHLEMYKRVNSVNSPKKSTTGTPKSSKSNPVDTFNQLVA